MKARCVMFFFVVFLVVTTAFAVLCPVTSNTRELPGWRGWLARTFHRRVTRPTVKLIRRIPHPRREVTPDPFEALRVQTRLGAVADEIRTLHFDGRIYARAARLEARSAAYDALLCEACELAGVEVDVDQAERRDATRMRQEVELASRGWYW